MTVVPFANRLEFIRFVYVYVKSKVYFGRPQNVVFVIRIRAIGARATAHAQAGQKRPLGGNTHSTEHSECGKSDSKTTRTG